jgi:hypothetical protein
MLGLGLRGTIKRCELINILLLDGKVKERTCVRLAKVFHFIDVSLAWVAPGFWRLRSI